MRALLIFSLLTACTGVETTNDLEFAGETPVLPGFSYDTGMQPSSGPIQIQLQVAVGGSLAARAQAVAGGSGDHVAVAAVPGSGSFTLDAHVRLGGMLHVDVSGMKYDGPIPGIENIDIAFGGQTTFDPFLMTSTASVTALLPETKLPAIPLPGGLPGHLELTVAAGSTMTSVLSGSCANFEGNNAKYVASTATSANLILTSKVVLKVPIIGDKDFGLPTITIPVPAVEAALDLGAQAFAGGGEPPTGELAKAGACGGIDDPTNPDGGGSGEGGGGDGVCEAVDAEYDTAWHPPNGLHTGACNATQVAALNSQCFAATATAASCSAFQAQPQNTSCLQCVVTSEHSPGYGAIVAYDTFQMFNLPGCLAAEAPGELQCAKTIQNYYACIDQSCGGCADSPGAEHDACIAAADATTCATESTSYDLCINRIAGDHSPGYACFESYDYVQQFCGN